jgi:hypothetical protein
LLLTHSIGVRAVARARRVLQVCGLLPAHGQRLLAVEQGVHPEKISTKYQLVNSKRTYRRDVQVRMYKLLVNESAGCPELVSVNVLVQRKKPAQNGSFYKVDFKKSVFPVSTNAIHN